MDDSNSNSVPQAHDMSKQMEDDKAGMSMPHMPYQPLFVNGANLAETWEKAVKVMMQQGYNRFVRAPDKPML